MAAKTQITNKGLELMASSSKATGQHWWIGWYALAFVPDELQDAEDEQLTPSMTKLTKDGDIIYNIFQGDMNGDGYQTTKASNKFKSVNYDSNIKKNYRYVLDEDGRNNLVTWVDGEYGLKGAYIYQGVKVNASRDDDSIDYAKSLIPLPAPLLYTGVKAAGEGWSESGMDTFLGSGNDSIENFYPVDEVGEDVVPRVSTDFRNYEGYKNGLPNIEGGDAEDYAHELGETFNGVDIDGWFPSVSTYTQNDETDMGEDYNQYCYQYWKVLSISNFNKYCAPVNASGLLYDENTGCRNMAKATKYFPISDYSVTSTAKTEDNEYATGIKLRVQLKLNGNAEDSAYFKEVETGDDDNVATLNPSPTDEQHALFNTQKVSFKFNRIGIYAVPMRQYGCSDDSGEMTAQYQIDTEAEPVLFAVCEWDSPVTLSDSGEGLSEFQSDIFIDLSAAVEDSSVIRESAVYYNLYEDDAIDWYKNQLLANASMAEALVNMQIEMGYLRNQKNAKAGCCPKQEEIKQNTKGYTGLRNLVDAREYESNSVRNRLAQEEGSAVDAVYSDIISNVYTIGSPVTSNWNLYARKTSDGADGVYVAYGGGVVAPTGELVVYSDAEIDGNNYLNMAPSVNIYGAIRNSALGTPSATRIGKFWLRNQLYYELYSFIKPTSAQITSNISYDYPDSVDTNEFVNMSDTVVDYVGSGSLNTDLPYVTITKTNTEITTTDDGVVTVGLPSELTDAELVTEISRSLQNYEEKRVYKAYYVQGETSRSYSNYKAERTTTLKLPKIQLYQIDDLSTVNQRMSSTGWRIPSFAEWTEICSNITEENITAIRSGSKWKQTGGTGSVYPLGAGLTGRVGTSLYYDPDSPAIYLAIADKTDQVVKFDGAKFEIVSPPSAPEYTCSFVAVLCIADAVKVIDAMPKYKLGYDSYALMEGSISAGSHNFNAGENSVISESANYNSIFGGMYNKISDSSHNTVLNGHSNELLDSSVYSVVFGHSNTLKLSACRMLVDSCDTNVSGGATCAIFTEFCTIKDAYQSSILGARNAIKDIVCSRFIGQETAINNEFRYSDALTYATYHLPPLYMSRAIVTNDHRQNVPDGYEYSSSSRLAYSEIIANEVYFWKKKSQTDDVCRMAYSRLYAGGDDVGIINVFACYSDIVAYGYGNQNSWLYCKTLESLSIAYSTIKTSESSITSNFIDNGVEKSLINYFDIALSRTAIQMSDSSEKHTFSFGVMKLSDSTLCRCDCSYVYESGTRHYLNSAQVHYATLVGNLISLTSSYIRNTHIYGSLTLAGNIDNHIILGGLDGTTVGSESTSASSFVAEFGSCILSNYKNYPMIWSMGGLGLFMNKMVLGNNGVSTSKAPSVGDVLSVVDVEDNMATVAWKSGGTIEAEAEYGRFIASNVTATATLTKTRGNIELSDNKIQLKKGSFYHFTVRGSYQVTTLSNTLSTLSFIEYATSNSLMVNVDNSISDAQFFELSFDVVANNDIAYPVAFTIPNNAKVNSLEIDVHSVVAGTNSNSAIHVGSGNATYNVAGDALICELSACKVYCSINSENYCEIKVTANDTTIVADQSNVKSINENFDVYRSYNQPWNAAGTYMVTGYIYYNINNYGTIDIDILTTDTKLIHLTIWYRTAVDNQYSFTVVEKVRS